MYADLKDVVATSDDDTASSGRRKRSRKDRDDSRLTWKEVHEILHIIQTMEVAWMNARMDNFDAHPLNRGWVAVFHRWATMPAFRRAWPILRAEFSRPFIDYLESRFSLTVTFSDLQTVPSARSQSPDVLRILTDEFTSEWPEVDSRFLEQPVGRNKSKTVWYVYPLLETLDKEAESRSELKDVPMGFVALLPPQKDSDSGLSPTKWGPYSCVEKVPELRFWVRPQYRFLGVGREMLDRFALTALQDELPLRPLGRASGREKARSPWYDGGDLVTRYLVRTGQSSGYSLRRRMQLGFLYEYSFARQDNRSYDEPTSVIDSDPHPSERGLDCKRHMNPQERIVPTILRTSWQRFFESVRAVSPEPERFRNFAISPTAQ